MEKIIKFDKFFENVQDTPEDNISTALLKIKKKIEAFFDENTEKEKEPQKIIKMSQALQKGVEDKEKKNAISFKELHLTLDSSELSRYSSIDKNIKIIFSDDENRYDLYITIPLEEGVPKDKDKDFSEEDIKKCYVKFKKYDKNSDLIGQVAKTIDISSISEELLINLKIELDEEFEPDKKEFEIETNDENEERK